MRHSRKIRKTKNSNMRKEGHCEAAVFLFCVLVQNGRVSLAKRGNLACPAGAQEGRHQGFHPLVNHPFPKRAQWLFRTETIKERQRIFSSAGRTMCVHVSAYSQCQIPYCYTCGLLYAACGITVPHKSLIWILQTAPANYAYHVLFTLNASLWV